MTDTEARARLENIRYMGCRDLIDALRDPLRVTLGIDGYYLIFAEVLARLLERSIDG